MAIKRNGRNGKSGEKKYTPLTDPEFRKSSLAPIPIEFRKQWLEMYTRYHEPHAEVSKYTDPNAIQTITADSQAVTEIVTIQQESYWRKSGNNIYYYEGNIAVGDAPNDTNTIYAKGNILIQSDSAQPYLKISNKSATERDPVEQFSVGATPAVKFTFGLDDSDSDNFKWCNTDSLVDTITGGTGFGDFVGSNYLGIVDANNNRVKVHLPADALNYVSQFGSNGTGDDNFSTPTRICTDGTYYYIVDAGNNRIKKHRLSDGLFIWAVGTFGSGDDQFNGPDGICTDGTYLYITDKVNWRIKKHLCSTGAYVAKLGSIGTALGQFVSPTGICTDGVYLYITEGSPGSAPLLKKHLCSDLSGIAQISADGHIDSANCQGICTDGNNLYIVNSNNSSTAAIFKYTRSLVYVSEYGGNGSGDTQFNGPMGICTDKIYLYVSDTANHRIKKHLASTYAFVSKIGSNGNGDNQFTGPKGICIGYFDQGYLGEARTGKLLVLHQDGANYDVYPLLNLYNYLVFHEDSVAATNYVAFRTPSSVTSYLLTLPGASAAAKKHLYTDAADNLNWGQNVDTDGSPIFANITDSGLTGSKPVFTDANKVLVSTGTVPVNQGGTGLTSYAVGDMLYASAGTTLAKLADVAIGSYLRSGGVATVPLWSTLILPDTATANRLLVATATNTIGELAAVGSTGQYLAGVTGAIPAWANISAFEPALGNPGTSGWILSSTDAGVRSWIAPGGGAASFVDLDDVPADYAGAGGYIVKVKGDASGLEFVAGGAGVSSFNDLDDVPASYVGQEGLFVRVNATANGLEYAAGGGGGAPTDAKYIVQEVNAGLSAEQSLGALTTGLLKNTVTGNVGVLSKATAGTDYEAALGNPDVNYKVLASTAAGVRSWINRGYGFNPDFFPVSPTSQSDHFDDASLNVKWTEFDPGGKLTVTEANHSAKFAITSQINNWSGIWQALPAGDFTITAKLRYEYNSLTAGKYHYFGIVLYQDATNNPTTSDLVAFCSYLISGTRVNQIIYFTKYDTYSSAPYASTGIAEIMPTACYFRVRRNGTTWYFDTSGDGLSWKYWATLAQGTYFVPAEFGIGCWQDSGATQNLYCDWIYYQASDNFAALGE